MPTTKDDFVGRLAALVPSGARFGAEASAARKFVREHFDTITTTRERGITWRQIAETMSESGVRAADGSKLRWEALKGLYHAERRAKGFRRKRRVKKPRVTPVLAPDTPEARPTREFEPVPAPSARQSVPAVRKPAPVPPAAMPARQAQPEPHPPDTSDRPEDDEQTIREPRHRFQFKPAVPRIKPKEPN